MSARYFVLTLKTFSVAFAVMAVLMAYFMGLMFKPGADFTFWEILSYRAEFVLFLLGSLLTTFAWTVEL